MGTSLQIRVLNLLSAAKRPLHGREVQEKLNQEREDRLAYTTVLTVLTRLVNSGAVARHRNGRQYMYHATCRDEVGLAVRKVLTSFGTDAVAHFVDQAYADPALRAQLRLAVDGSALLSESS
ncbi:MULTISPECIES: BlaI/MecI/CopY family transcriptional regulator [unclassified Streptomyces]|uniref:BlaI/MecI/CopY family transcriptional regulator n=1 Tax=unclassified Streptomyces TaxID=2593676 RepID=UPI00168B5C5B|nr:MULTISPECIES: BlaI/MecI/CopY family transcriptional regulator [unclassified Streptomyces]MBD3007222.1 BlaI/MecI/CopY family transcriptional regulator [Streptomyces sp. 5-10]